KGIDENEQDLIFEPFYKSRDSVNKDIYGGSGVGLSICKVFVERIFHGKIWVESTVGEGTTICFTAEFNFENIVQDPIEVPWQLIQFDFVCKRPELYKTTRYVCESIVDYLNSKIVAPTKYGKLRIAYITREVDFYNIVSHYSLIPDNIALVVGFELEYKLKKIKPYNQFLTLTKPLTAKKILALDLSKISPRTPCYDIEFPIAIHPSLPEPLQRQKTPAKQFNQKQVLVVEDNPLIMRMMSMFLKKSNFTFDIAGT
ncbi:ATPase domain of HSP90 chaperone/DNA topoisomerase II/histidine kinase, partial [Rozella allomycis CSF55]